MFRILQCDKDAYITDKIIKSERSTLSNTGQAGTLDLYKLYNETDLSGSTTVYEKTRILTHFDLSSLQAITASTLNINDSSFKCYLSLGNIYHGQPVPSNFTIVVNPLARPFTEGRGFDVVGYQDKDVVNWITASIINGTPDYWALSGANQGGGLGTSNIDYFTSGVLSSGSVPLSVSFTFNRGDEDLLLDITTLVSATLVGLIPDYGFRIALTASQDTDLNTYFVKRFSSRHVKNPFERPTINVQYNDSFIDNQVDAFTDIVNTFSIYNTYLGQYRNFFSGSSQISGSNCLMLNMFASRSLTVWTSSYSPSHSQSINCLTSSTIHYSASFTGSQLSIGGKFFSGSYFANVTFDPHSAGWLAFTNATDWRGEGQQIDVSFGTRWTSLDGTLVYSDGAPITVKRLRANPSNVFERNFIVNVTNLKQTYFQNEQARMRVFIQDYNVELKFFKLPVDLTSAIYEKMFWRLINAYTKEVLIPFDTTNNSTKLSSDGNGMYFDMYIQDLPVEQVYELEFLIREGEKDYYVTNQGFRFKISR